MSFNLSEAQKLKQSFDTEVATLKTHIGTANPYVLGRISKDALAEALEDFDADTIAQFILALRKSHREDLDQAQQESLEAIKGFKNSLRTFIDELD